MFTVNTIQKRIYYLKKASTQWRVACFLRNGEIQSDFFRSLWIFLSRLLGWLPYVDTFFSVMFLFNFLGLSPNFMQKSTNVYVIITFFQVFLVFGVVGSIKSMPSRYLLDT